jgi:rhodanese-related sulfurtransferase
MKIAFYFFAIPAITLAVADISAAQAPVLFDGTDPVVFEAAPFDDAIPKSQLIMPEELAQSLRSPKQELFLFQVGPHTLYAQAHIPGSEYTGSGDEGQQKLRARVKSLPRNSAIVIYCGCCPWIHCPNVGPAYQLLHSLGFSNVKVVYFANNFGDDWVSKGYPVARGD